MSEGTSGKVCTQEEEPKQCGGSGGSSGGSDGGGGGGKRDHHVRYSKALSWLLRHGAIKEGLHVYSGGWVKLRDVLSKPKFKKVSVDEVKELVEKCPKQRFALKEEDNILYIRANQGHSIKIDDSDLEEITSSIITTTTTIPQQQVLPSSSSSSSSVAAVVLHGTYYRQWDAIKSKGLSRMSRTHIHFAPGLPGEHGVISGLRSSCEIYIYIDIAKALEDGFKFYRSSNNVILCPGDDKGYLPAKYFDKVVDKKTGERLL